MNFVDVLLTYDPFYWLNKVLNPDPDPGEQEFMDPDTQHWFKSV